MVRSTPKAMNRIKRKRRLVFVSHSSMDIWVAQQIAGAIRKCGAEAFLDEAQIDVGADFEDVILSSLNKADELVVLLTPWALKRPYIWAEIGACWGRGIPIVGLLHGMTSAEFQSQPEFPVFLKKRDLIELNKIDTYLIQLKQRSSTPPRKRVN
jgi:hypothetical protein